MARFREFVHGCRGNLGAFVGGVVRHCLDVEGKGYHGANSERYAPIYTALRISYCEAIRDDL